MQELNFPKVIFIMGLPGTGKTYLARHLSNLTKTKHISSDIVRKQLHKKSQYQEDDKFQVYQEMKNQLAETLQKKQNVIVDATFYKQTLRTDFKLIAQPYTENLFWILATANEETIKKRTSQKRPDSEADFEVYKLIKSQFEPLTTKYLEIRTDESSVEENLEKILNYCKLNYDEISN